VILLCQKWDLVSQNVSNLNRPIFKYMPDEVYSAGHLRFSRLGVAIKLKETGDNRKGLKPIAKYSGIELDLVA
jgi:hypothetical protein